MLTFLDKENTWLVFSFMERCVLLHQFLVVRRKTKKHKKSM